MLRYYNFDIVFQEVPDEICLAINISGCPNQCKGCHSPHLMQAIGDILDEESLTSMLMKYRFAITCVCFMGGDANPQIIEKLARKVKQLTKYQIKTAWYSGKDSIPQHFDLNCMDFIKLGAYKEKLGGLNSLTSNQQFFRVTNGQMINQTNLFLKLNNP